MVTLARSRSAYMVDIPLTWKPVKKSDGRFTATVVCQNQHCGMISEHIIDGEGYVSPSVVCSQNGCTWHEYVQLIGWLED